MRKHRISPPPRKKQTQRRSCKDWVPLGIRWQSERSILAACLAVSALISLVFPSRFAEQYANLYITADASRILRAGARMEDFSVLMRGALLGFLVTALLMVFLAAYHYRWHFQGSKSIYLMRRLPSKYELARRCLAVPVLGILLAALTAFLLACLYYAVYIRLTPPQCLTPGQWQAFWSF